MEFFFNNDERKELFNFIQLKGGLLIPDVFFKSEEYVPIVDYEEFSRFQRTETTHFFLIADEFVIEPLKVSRNRFVEEPKYAINQRKGGPYIDLSFYRGHANDAKIPYMGSVIDIYSKFIHVGNHEEFKAPDKLRGYFKDIVKYIKSKCVVVEKGGKKYWISTEVLKEIDI
ncbi:hypothetical protein [Mucilaginibacter polytrichastri]|uniref:hypothetical protein n=1 Tax=Mucilaginibacter polytrichastri TaxID=1302689 RepID=UPI000A4CEF44|nr:hypothetical protein [Mucilaginibacter polytrichastri]